MSENNSPINPDFMQEDELTSDIPSSIVPEQNAHEQAAPQIPVEQPQQSFQQDAPVYQQPQQVAPQIPVEQPQQPFQQDAPVYQQPQQVAPQIPVEQPQQPFQQDAPVYQQPQQVAPQIPVEQPQQPFQQDAPVYQQPQQAAPQIPVEQPQQPFQQDAPAYQQPQQAAPQVPVEQPQQPFQQDAPVYQQPQQYPQYTTPPVMDPLASNVAVPNWDGTAVKQEKKSAMPIVIIALSLLVLGIVGFLVYRFVLFDPAAHNPKGTLMTAMENTQLDLKSTGITLPNQEKFTDQAISQTFNVTLDSAPDIIEFQPSLSGAKVSLGLQSDLDNRETMLAFGFRSDVIEIPNSKVYFTSDQTVIESSLLHDKPLLIDNKTFVRDWNASDYGEYSFIVEDGTLKDSIDEAFDLFEAVDPEKVVEYEEMFNEFESSLLASETLLNESMVVTHRETKDGRYVFDAVLKGSDVETYIEDVAGVTEDLIYTIVSSMPDVTGDDIDYYMTNMVEGLDLLRDELYFADEIALEFVVAEETKRLIEYRILPTILTAETYNGEIEIEMELEILFSGEEGIIKDIEVNILGTPMEYPDEQMAIEIKRLSTVEDGKDSVRWEMLLGYKDVDYPDNYESYTVFLDYTWDQNIANEDNFFLKMGMKAASNDEEYLINVRGLLVETTDSLSLSEGSLSFVYDNAQQFKVGFDYSCSVIEKGSIMPNLSDGVDFFSVDPEDLVSGLNNHLSGAL